MQLFVLDQTVEVSAQSLCNKHVVSQLGETAELLALAHLRAGEPAPPFSRLKPRVRGHLNHPCTVWVAYSSATYNWTYDYAIALCAEYTLRFRRMHAYEPDIRRMVYAPFSLQHRILWTPWPQVMPKEFQAADPVEAYREYYQHKARSIPMRWSRRTAPVWYRQPYARHVEQTV